MSTLVNFEEELRFEKLKNEKMESIKKIKNERSQKFAEFDKEFLKTGPELNTVNSLFKYQPIIALECFQAVKEKEVEEAGRRIELITSRDSEETPDIFRSFDNFYVNYLLSNKYENEDLELLHKDVCEMLEVTRGFCYTNHGAEQEWKKDYWQHFENNDLKWISAWDKGKEVLETCNNLEKVYDLNEMETMNLFANTIFVPEIIKSLTEFENNKFFNDVCKKFANTTEKTKAFDETLCKSAIVRYKFVDLKTEFRNHMTLADEGLLEVRDTLKKLYDRGFEKTASLLAGRLKKTEMWCQGKFGNKEIYDLDNGIADENVIELFHDSMKIYLNNEKGDNKRTENIIKISEELEKENSIGNAETQGIWKRFLEEKDKNENNYGNIDIKKVFNGKMADRTFISGNFLNFNRNDEVLVAGAIIFPDLFQYFKKEYRLQKDFDEEYFNKGGSLEEYCKRGN